MGFKSFIFTIAFILSASANVFSQENHVAPQPPTLPIEATPTDIVQKPGIHNPKKRSTTQQKRSANDSEQDLKHPEVDKGPEPPRTENGYRKPQPKQNRVTRHNEEHAIPVAQPEEVLPPALPPGPELVIPD